MKCKACDCDLTNNEAALKGPVTGEYMDLCHTCLSPIMDELGLVVDNESDEKIVEDASGSEELPYSL